MGEAAFPIVPTDGMEITADTILAPGVYHLPNGLRIVRDDICLDGNGALIVGTGREGRGVQIEGLSGVIVQNLCLAEFYHGIWAKGCEHLTLRKNRICSTQEIAPNTIFLDIWLPAPRSYGGGILLWDCRESLIEENDLQHQMNGLLCYGCSKITVRRNEANYNSGYGVHLFGTCDSLFEENSADYCCRFNLRGEGWGHSRHGHMGADATGFLIVAGSHRNIFRRNCARLGGDGFFLAGMTPGKVRLGCDDNLFEENDGSLSPNIAFEATFSRGNIFRNNLADRCNFGFWLGYSWETTVEDNRMVMNRQAGIAVENGHHIEVRRNNFQANGHGILLWNGRNKTFAEAMPEHMTSHHWLIEKNTFTRNWKAIRIAAWQDHGIRDLEKETDDEPIFRPHDHLIRENDIQDNRIGIDLEQCDRTEITRNIIHRNVEANLREQDSSETRYENNLGPRGAYL